MIGLSKNHVPLCPFSYEWELLFKEDRHAYTKRKSEFIIAVITLAKQEV